MARCQPSRGWRCRVFRAGELTGHHVRAGAAAEDLRHLPAGLSVIRTGFQREEAGAEGVLSPTGVCRLSRGPPQCCREWASSLRALSASGRQGVLGSCPVAAAIPCVCQEGTEVRFQGSAKSECKRAVECHQVFFFTCFYGFGLI